MRPRILFIPQPILCGWCNATPDTAHDAECPERDDASDFPAFCGRCGVYFISNCDCPEEQP